MIYKADITLTANTPFEYENINLAMPSRHFIQVDAGGVVVRARLRDGMAMQEVGNITQPGLYEIPIAVQSFEFESSADMTIALCGA